MAGPWEQYQAAEAGPWSRFAAPTTQPVQAAGNRGLSITENIGAGVNKAIRQF